MCKKLVQKVQSLKELLTDSEMKRRAMMMDDVSGTPKKIDDDSTNTNRVKIIT